MDLTLAQNEMFRSAPSQGGSSVAATALPASAARLCGCWGFSHRSALPRGVTRQTRGAVGGRLPFVLLPGDRILSCCENAIPLAQESQVMIHVAGHDERQGTYGDRLAVRRAEAVPVFP